MSNRDKEGSNEPAETGGTEVSVKAEIIQILRMCGHAFVRTVHERLDHTDEQLGLVIEQNNAMARTDTALLQSAIHTVKSLRQIETDLYPRVTSLVGSTDIMLKRLSSLTEIAEAEMVRQVCVETDDYGFTNPETGLASHLYSFLPNRRVADVGAHVGDVAGRLLETGYEVYAFEPFPASYEKLTARHGGEPRFHGFNFALGAEEKQAELRLPADRSGQNVYDDATVFNTLTSHSMPEDLPYTKSVSVPVRTISAMIAEGSLPSNIDLLKIDTEGYDLEVIKGLGELRPPVVEAEYWDTEIPFARSGLLYTFESMVGEMRQRGYGWHIALYRVWGRNQTAFYANHSRAVPNTWGNLVFFRNFDLFREGLKWCSAVLPYTYFKTAAASHE